MGLPDLPHLEKILQPPPEIIAFQKGLLLLRLEDSKDFEIPDGFAQIVGLQGGVRGPVEQLEAEDRKLHFPQPAAPAFHLPFLVGRRD